MAKSAIMRSAWRLAVAGVLVLLTAHAGPAAGAEPTSWQCEVSSKMNCMYGKCEPGAMASGRQWMVLDFTANTYARCDQKGCDVYRASRASSGAFTVVELPGRGSFIKMSNDGSAFVDTATVGVGVVLSFGTCRQQ